MKYKVGGSMYDNKTIKSVNKIIKNKVRQINDLTDPEIRLLRYRGYSVRLKEIPTKRSREESYYSNETASNGYIIERY